MMNIICKEGVQYKISHSYNDSTPITLVILFVILMMLPSLLNDFLDVGMTHEASISITFLCMSLSFPMTYIIEMFRKQKWLKDNLTTEDYAKISAVTSQINLSHELKDQLFECKSNNDIQFLIPLINSEMKSSVLNLIRG